MTAIKLDANQVYIDGDQIVVVADGEWHVFDPYEYADIGFKPSIRCAVELRAKPWMTTTVVPCKTCRSTLTDPGWIYNIGGWTDPCPDCRDGRPTLTIEVACGACGGSGETNQKCKAPACDGGHVCPACHGTPVLVYRLTASEVLPVVDATVNQEHLGCDFVAVWPSGATGIYRFGFNADFNVKTVENEWPPFPPAATPGQFALIGRLIP